METLKGIGKQNIIQAIEKSPGSIISQDFLKELVKQFLKSSNRFIQKTGLAPFSYRERQIHSVMAPAISKLTDAFIIEYPVDRKWKSKSHTRTDTFGWVDYWANYRNIDFYIELKHNYLSYRTGNFKKDAITSWKQAMAQLSAAKEYTKSDTSEKSKGSVYIALDIITIYQRSENKIKYKSLNSDEGKLIDIQNKSMLKFSPRPNWSDIVIFREELINKSYSELDKGFEYYPGLFFLAHVSGLKT